MDLRTIYHKLKKQKMLKAVDRFVQLDEESCYGDGFYVELRNPKAGYIYLKTGKHCVIDGHFTFETEGGSIQIGDRVHIGNSKFISVNNIIIEDDVTIAWGCLFYDHNSHSVRWEERQYDTEQEYLDIKAGLNPIANKNWNVVKSAPIRICKKAWIGMDVKVLKGVTIGEGAVIGAGSVVTRDVEPWTMVGGNPARVIKILRR